MKETELVVLLEKQITVEKEQSRALDKTISETKSSVVRHLLNTVRLDTLRHIDLCQGIIDLVSEKDVTAPTSEVVLERIEEHMKAETVMLSQIKATIKKTENPMIRSMLRQLAADEARHHRLLESLKSEKLTVSRDGYIEAFLHPLAYYPAYPAPEFTTLYEDIGLY